MIELVSLILAVLRIAGERGEIFQAVAHLWVGGLTGAAWGRQRAGDGRWMRPGAAVVILSVVEIICFFAFRGHP